MISGFENDTNTILLNREFNKKLSENNFTYHIFFFGKQKYE